MGGLRHNLLGTLRRRGFESVPLDFVLCEAQIESFRRRFGHEDYSAYFGMAHREVHVPLKRRFQDGRSLFSREALPEGTEFDDWGIGRSPGSELAHHMKRMHHPLKGSVSAKDILDYPLPSVDESGLPGLRRDVAALHDRGLAACGFLEMTVWETSWYLRSLEDLMVDMMLGDEKAAILLDRMTDCARRRAGAFAQAGVDILRLGDDIGSQTAPLMSLELWRKWLKPRLADVIDASRRVKPDLLILYHSCGFVTPFIPELIEIGVDVLNPVQPECMDFQSIHARYGDRLSFWGTIGTQRLLPFGTPEQVRETVRARLLTCGEPGGIVIGPTHMVEPEVPWENLTAVREAAESFTAGRRPPPGSPR